MLSASTQTKLQKMRAALVSQTGDDPKVQFIRHRFRPAVGAKEVLVRIKAVSLTPLDIQVLRGEFEALAQPPFVPGSFFAGTIAELGEHVYDFALNTEVVGILPIDAANGALAEYTVVPTALLVRRPEGVTPENAAAILAPGLSAFTALHYQLQVGFRNRSDNEASLLYFPPPQCASTILPILASKLGLRVFVATGDPSLIDLYGDCYAVQRVIDLRGESVVDVIFEETAGLGVQYIFDEFSGQDATIAPRSLLMKLITSVGEIHQTTGLDEQQGSGLTMRDIRLAMSPEISHIPGNALDTRQTNTRFPQKDLDSHVHTPVLSEKVRAALTNCEQPLPPIPSLPSWHCDSTDGSDGKEELENVRSIPAPTDVVHEGQTSSQIGTNPLPGSEARQTRLNRSDSLEADGSNSADGPGSSSTKSVTSESHNDTPRSESGTQSLSPEQIAERALQAASDAICNALTSRSEVGADGLSGLEAFREVEAQEADTTQAHGESLDDDTVLCDEGGVEEGNNAARKLVKQWLDQDASESPQSRAPIHVTLLIKCLSVGGRILTCNSLIQLDPPQSRLLMLRGGAIMFHFPINWVLSPTYLGKYAHILRELLSLLSSHGIEAPHILRYTLERIRYAYQELRSLRTAFAIVTV